MVPSWQRGQLSVSYRDSLQHCRPGIRSPEQFSDQLSLLPASEAQDGWGPLRIATCKAVSNWPRLHCMQYAVSWPLTELPNMATSIQSTRGTRSSPCSYSWMDCCMKSSLSLELETFVHAHGFLWFWGRLQLHVIWLFINSLCWDVSGQASMKKLRSPYGMEIHSWFHLPNAYVLVLFNAMDSHLEALKIFFQSPQCINIPVVHLSCFSGKASLPLIAAVLTSIKVFGCQILSYSARSDPSVPCISAFPQSLLVMPSHLESFSSSCNNIFSPYITLCHSPLRKLVLQDAGLSTCIWGKLLQSLDLPLLICLEVDCQCSITTLLTFLQWHPCIQYLCISTYGKESTWQSQCPPICLPSLQTLAGPPVYLKSLLQYIDHHILVTVLLIKLADIKPGVPQILQVLDCVQSLPHLHDTHISFHQNHHHRNSLLVISMTGLIFPKSKLCTGSNIWLEISVAFNTVTDGEEIVVCTVHIDVDAN